MRGSSARTPDVAALIRATVSPPFVADYIPNMLLDFVSQLCYESHQPCASRGVSGDGPVGGARRGVPRRRLVTEAPGGPGPRPPGTTTWPRGARCTDPEEMPEMEARDPGRKSPRWSAERRASPRWGTIRRLASAWRAAQKRVHARLGRASARCGCRCTRAPSRRSATPRGGMKEGFKPRAQCVAGTRKCEWRV